MGLVRAVQKGTQKEKKKGLKKDPEMADLMVQEMGTWKAAEMGPLMDSEMVKKREHLRIGMENLMEQRTLKALQWDALMGNQLGWLTQTAPKRMGRLMG